MRDASNSNVLDELDHLIEITWLGGLRRPQILDAICLASQCIMIARHEEHRDRGCSWIGAKLTEDRQPGTAVLRGLEIEQHC